MTTEVTLAARLAQEDAVIAALMSPSPNWREGFADAWNGEQSCDALPNYCEGYAAGVEALRSIAA